MCIRDRRKDRGEKIRDQEPPEKPPNPFLQSGLEGALGFEAVSYTHLRAHETVLDLVCRLLLEKKQKNHRKNKKKM